MEYKEKAQNARKKVLEMIYKGQSSHIGSNFSVIDIMTVLFDKVDFSKDKIILSAGWKAASFYYFLSEAGFIPKEELETYCQEGSRLIGLTEPGIPGVHFAGGSMGMGFPAAVGFALSQKLQGLDGKVYVIMSDGELQCGTTWEASLIAIQHKLDNLHVLVDYNGLQAMGKVDDILHAYFPKGFDSRVGDNGHNFYYIENALASSPTASKEYPRPRVTTFITTKGKGVSFMENNNLYHYKNLTREEYDNALKEL